jgi:2-methylisocitrate lyase-like PEP mutase family enzyme
MTAASRLRRMLKSGQVIAPAVFSPLSARLAQDAGFQALYLSGGALGYLKCVMEANLDLHDVLAAGQDIMLASDLPLILDAACGYGDPMHQHRTIRMAEQVGFAAIEIEDQLLPKRVHHHVGLDHIIPAELMVAKVEEAVRARRDPDFIIIARTNAVRREGLDEGLRRGEAMLRAGADMLFFMPATMEETIAIGRAFGPNLLFAAPNGFDQQALGGVTAEELHGYGYGLIADGGVALLAAHAAMRDAYRGLAGRQSDSARLAFLNEEARRLHATTGLERLLEIERRTLKL